MNGTRLNFSQSGDGVYTYSNTRFRLTYTEERNDGNEITSAYLTVTGLTTTASPVYLTLVDEIRLDSDGSDVLYEIETNFAISVGIYSDQDRALPIRTAEEFLSVADEGQAADYILLNDITLTNYTPISSSNFRSLDGNGYTINIESFNLEGSGTLNLALFTTISTDSVIKNVRVNYYQSQPITVDVTSTGYSNINIAGLAITNNGTVTNTQVVAYKTASTSFTNSGDIGIIVNYVRGSTPVYIDANSSISSQVAGFVITNSGSITNSKVGGEEIIIIGEQVADSDRFEYTTESLSTFTISAQGTVSGFVITNSGDIASSSASQVQITNLASSNQTQTAGFVITNSGDIRASAVQGVKRQGTGNDADTYHRTGSNISANGTVSGFAIRNTTTGVISDGYSNILISDRSTQNSLTSAGFIYQNEGYIETSYAASYVEKANIRQLSFSGVDSTGHSLNTGTIELSYYYIADYDDDTASDVEGTLDSANLISREEVENQNAYYGFIFNSTSSAGDGIWTLIEGEGVEPVSLSTLTISHRYYVAGQDGEYFLPYSILINSGDSFAPDYDTTYGEDINPILITSAQDFQEAMGASTSTSVGGQFNDTEIFGSYRFAADIDLSELNNDIGNAEVGSVDRIFSGQIDGNGFTINNISLSSSNNAVGLFAETRNALIQNLNIEINSITAGNSVVVGGLVGVAKDSRIINIQMSQRTTVGDSEETGVHGRNITGGIVGAAFGQSVLVGLSATDAIVQSGYYNNSTANDFDQAIYSRGDWAFNAQAVRTYAEANSSQLYAADGLGQTSFAGGLVGYLDIYTASQVLQTGYIYVTNLSNSDYSVSNLRVNNSIDVRAEIVGGLIGYTGPQTRVQDAGIYFSNEENTYANLLSYNFAAGGLVGLANGDFYQVFAQYEQTLQDEIESSTSQYYGGASTTERGLTDIFEGTANEVGAQSYQPKFVGGLFGVIGTGRVYIAYSKINAINPQNGGYAGGIAGGVYNASEFLIDDPASSSSQATIATTLLLNEVYASGDVYAEGVFNNVATHFGGLFGRFLNVGSTNVKLSMAAVNAVNEYGILGEGYYSESNPTGINEINALVGTMGDGASVFVYAVSASGQNLPDVSDIKSYGYMNSYTSGSLTVNVVSGVYKEAESGGYEDADYVFRIESVSSFTSPEDGFTDTNGAFINSNAWSSDNWIHETTKLYPDINLVNTSSYIYLDQDNVDSVVARMQNSSIEVRVRGKRVDENGNVSYGYVDLRVRDYTIENFTGRLVGAVDNSWFVNSNFGAYTNGDENSTDIFSNNYPGIIVDGTLFETPLSGATFQNLNIVFDSEPEGASIGSSFISGTNLQDLTFSDINAWFVDGVSITAEESGGNAYGGLFVSSATNTSFRNILLQFSATNTDSGNIVKFTTSTNNNNDEVQYTDAAFGLLAGQLVQGSPFDALRVQNITIKHNVLGANGPDADHALMRVAIGASAVVENLYAGLYVGNIKNSEGGQYAGVNITARAPQSASDDNTASFTSALGIGAGFSVAGTAYIGGFVGKISTQGTAFTLIKDKSYSQTINIYADVVAKNMNIGGLFGDATLASFSTNITVEGTQQLFDSNIRLTRDVTENLYAGLLAGNISSGANISLNPTSRYTISGSISAAITSSTTETDTTGISGNAHLGGLVGRNNANITVTNLDLSFEIYGTGNGTSANENDFELTDTSTAFQAKAIDAGGLVGTNAGVLIIGEEQGVGESTGVSVNADREKLRLQATGGELNAGGLVGNMTGGSATIQELSDNTSIIWALGNTNGTTNVGGIIGYVTSGVSELVAGSDPINIENSQSDVNFFVSA